MTQQLKFYNTETKSKEIFTPLNHEKVSVYTCGPTVYNFAHIGNFRTYVFEDLLLRTLRYFGFNVFHVMNITDVDDKTIKGAISSNQSLEAFTNQYIQAFFDDLESLGIEKANLYPKATDHIEEMIDMIQALLEEGIAYQSQDGNIYFNIRKFPSYGRLSHLCLDELQEGASNRVHLDEYDRESASDFVLWKAYDSERDGKIYWESPFGKGRPGWHIECSAMATKHLGDSLDIHCGGVDNIFPHHENEIAQSECVTKKKFVNYWLHAKHLLVEGKKMSKSLGNFYTLRDLLDKGYSGKVIRLSLMQTHYRNQLNFTLEGLDAAKQTLNRIADFQDRLSTCSGKGLPSCLEILKVTKQKFDQALADDLNISSAFAALFDFIRLINGHIDQNEISKENAQQIEIFLQDLDKVLNIFTSQNSNNEIPKEILGLLEQRTLAKKEKNFALADKYRDQIHALGYVIEDTKEGAKLKKR